MKEILIDGSNICLNGASEKKLTTLDNLYRMINCLISNDIIPYTIFDASFRYFTEENSVARQEFNKLTKEISEFFQMSPAGENADLILLALAKADAIPVVSNDTFRDFGKKVDDVLTYNGTSEKIRIYNFQMIKGKVFLPDMDIMFTAQADQVQYQGLEAKFSACKEKIASEGIQAWNYSSKKVTTTSNTKSAEAPKKVTVPKKLEAQGQSSSNPQSPQAKVSVIDTESKQKIEKLINQNFAKDGSASLSNIGKQLGTTRAEIRKRLGLKEDPKRPWFGFASLGKFLKQTFPRYKIDGDKIKLDQEDKVSR